LADFDEMAVGVAQVRSGDERSQFVNPGA